MTPTIMIVLIFILVPLTLLGLGMFAIYAVLFVYFLPNLNLPTAVAKWRHKVG